MQLTFVDFVLDPTLLGGVTLALESYSHNHEGPTFGKIEKKNKKHICLFLSTLGHRECACVKSTVVSGSSLVLDSLRQSTSINSSCFHHRGPDHHLTNTVSIHTLV
uniref:Uncharacterized protein n=1 Tax=Nelumbo nucifera TaxID=4432 RepID=A0A822Z819_NELNU|nr:TPA_asm: hypothetical protein HUJ06_014144 [Nelumbo nucifera]